MKYTRKQALSRVLEILDKYECNDKNKIIDAIKELKDALPVITWDKTTIHDALQNYAIENKRNPTTNDLDKNGMPRHTTIQRQFDMKASEFLKVYYPNYSKKIVEPVYKNADQNYWLNDFINNFNLHKPHTSIQYNKMKNKDSPVWWTVAKLNNVLSWNELLKLCNLETTPQPRRKRIKMK